MSSPEPAVPTGLETLEPEVRQFAERLLRLPDPALHLARFSEILRQKIRRRRREAALLAVHARRLAPDNPEIRRATEWAVRDQVPTWHFPMIWDERRNEAYERALNREVTGAVVLEVGTGSGLVAMMAARAGAAHVYTCEAAPLVAAAAVENIRRNGLQDRITVIPKPAADVAVGTDLPRPADVFVAELVDSRLLSDGVLPLTADAKRRLLQADARMLPRRIMIQGAVIEASPWTRTTRLATHRGFDLAAFNALAPAHAMVDDVHGRADGEIEAALSEDVTVLEFDLQDGTAWPAGERQVDVECRHSGRADALLTWIGLEFSSDNLFTNRPPQKSHWKPVVYPLAGGFQVRSGQTISLSVSHTATEVGVRIAEIR